MSVQASTMDGALASWNFSLLTPPGAAGDERQAGFELDPAAQHDLDIARIAAAFSTQKDKQKEIYQLLCTLIQDPEVIAYRQDVLEDLLAYPELVAELEALFPVIDGLVQYAYRTQQGSESLQEVIWRLGELQGILECVQGLEGIFAAPGSELHSHGLRLLREKAQALASDPTVQHLVKELPEIMSTLRACASITIGVNLDTHLRPVEVVLLSVHDQPFSEQSFMTKLFGLQNGRAGIAPMHSVPQRSVQGAYALPISPELGRAVDPMMVPLFADLSMVLQKTTAPIAKRLRQYTEVQGRMFLNLRRDLLFYLGAVRFIQRLQARGLPVCRPSLAPVDARLCLVKDAYNPNLALRMPPQGKDMQSGVITNAVNIGPDGRILILTGPNQGGKTTYMQGVGLVQLLAQVGCFVPGTQAEISPVDQILTHFPLEEQPDANAGRFGEEAARLGLIFQRVSRRSLVLLNESLSSTNSGESLYLAQDMVRILRRLGARVIYSTHLHELANQAENLNASVEGDSQIVSVVSSPVDSHPPDAGPADLDPAVAIERTYKVQARLPLGQSYAREIAARFGISYEQLEQMLAERGEL